jgi:hypothetical protein
MRPTTPAEALEQAADIIETRGWSQDALAYDRDGVECKPYDPRACSFCAEGALRHVGEVKSDRMDDDSPGVVWPAWLAFRKHVRALREATGATVPPIYSVDSFNDGVNQTVEVVAREMRACAAKLRQEAAS